MGYPTNQFTALPLMEVALRVVPSGPIPLSVELVSRLLKSELIPFTTIGDLDYIEIPPGKDKLQDVKPPLLGLSFEDHDAGVVVGVQHNLVVARWRRMATAAPPAYPRYARLTEYLVAAIRSLVSEVPLPTFDATVVNISYTNVEELDVNMPGGAVPIVSMQQISQGFSQNETKFGDLNFGWGESQYDLRVKLDRGQVFDGNVRREALILQSVCGTSINPGDSFIEALQKCHDLLNARFPKLIRPEMLEKWGYRNGGI